MYSKIESNKKATDKVFRCLKARGNVRMNHFKVKMTRVYYVFDLRGYQELVTCRLRFRGVKVPLEAINQQITFCLYIQRLNSMEVGFTKVLSGQDARSKVRMSYFGVRKELVKCCIRFEGFKTKQKHGTRKTTLATLYLKIKNNI